MNKKLQTLLWANRPGTNGATADLIKRRDLEDQRDRKMHGSPSTVWVTRQLIIDAFKELRSKGFIARANHLCCQSCAGSDLSDKAKKRIADGKKFNGIIFWHRQDEEGYADNGVMFIAYGGCTLDGVKYGKSDEEAGLALVTALVKRGVRCEWDGNANQRILVYA